MCCICFSNTLKHYKRKLGDQLVCVVFVLAILSNGTGYGSCDASVCVVFVLAILSNKNMLLNIVNLVCVVFVLAILSNTMKSMDT